ncbi:GGDEF domain-containing protein [Hoeflea sp. BAL378]|uniref:GGDEF domain-containing protein n=1 Tax=Hoeflea sp. BAL378 TaxID=1547437 RepID=UPI00068FBAC2|nr:GGDEF domain-containing protein [Hoeflea sp. BAL378]
MRFLEMWNPYTFVGREIASDRQVEETLRELYSSKPHIAAATGIGLASLTAGLSGAVWTGVLATLVALVCLAFRIVIERLFLARAPGALDPKWMRLFVTGSLLSGFGWGLSGALLLYGASPATQTITVAVACAIAQGAAGRAYMMPGTAFINIAFVIGQLSIAAAADGNFVFLPAGLLYFSFLSSFVLRMVRNRLRQLRSEQTADRLLAEITEKNELLRIANEALATKAYEDPLTGLANRRKFDRVFAEAVAAAQRDRSALSLMMIDVDHFKSFNDTYGHQAGDECLLSLSRAIKTAISGNGGLPDDGSLVARYGGEEFVALLPGEDRAGALAIAERVRLAVRLTALDALPNAPPRQTVSIGLVSCLAGPATTREAMLAAADEALYEAKKQGRNRVCVAATPGDTRLKALSGGTA